MARRRDAHRGEQHPCARCRARFDRASLLERHRRAVHGRVARARKAAAWGLAALAVAGAAAAATLLATAPKAAAPGLNLDGEPSLGSPDAPVLFVMMEDPHCPMCKRFHDQTFDALVREHVDTGQVQVFYKVHHGGNPWSFEGAMAQECLFRLGGHGAFWNATAKFYRDQGAINAAGGGPREAVRGAAMGYAQEEGLDPAAFAACYDRDEAAGEVLADSADAQTLGARGTPAFVIKPRQGGEPVLVVGAQPLEVFQRNILTALAQASAARA